jgi:hypothetical protein
MTCSICGARATHLCKSCGKWLCDSRECARRAAMGEIIHHPVRAASFLLAHPLESARVAGLILGPPKPR